MDDTVLEKNPSGKNRRGSSLLCGKKRRPPSGRWKRSMPQALSGSGGRRLTEAGARREQELAQMENRAVLERKKLRLRSLERFLDERVAETVRDLRGTRQYRAFLLASVRAAAQRISGEAQIRVKPEDLAWQDEILAAAGDCQSAAVAADPSIKWGGCLVRDAAGGRLFNGTLERIYFRKSALLRRKVVQLLADYSRSEKTATTPRPKEE
jgi:vacuolar-type H+-ATPase subunit E/Vma4